NTVGTAVQQLRPTVAATGPGKALVAFVDDRARFTGDDLPQAGIWAVPLNGDTPGAATRMDSTAAPAASAQTLDNSWAPSLAASGAIVVWQDHRHGDGDIYARGGGGPIRVDDSGRTGWNQWRPAIAISGKNAVVAWEDERDGPPQIFFARAPVRRIG